MRFVLPYVWLDVFASAPFCGNQLCVLTAPADLASEVMQKLARELNHSETTFLQVPARVGADCRVRIWIPALPLAEEVPFAGHPVLGTACVAVLDRTESCTVQVETGVGVIPVTVTPAGDGVWEASMAQPLPRVVRRIEETTGLAEALGLAPGAIRAGLPVEAVDNGMQTVLIPLASLADVHRVRPDMARLRALLGRDGLCTLVFAPGGVEPGTDVHCRVFSPFDLVTEDPATGSANGPLGEYLVRHGVVPGPAVRSEQGYMVGRPSQLAIAVERRDGQTKAVHVSGRVELVGRGEFRVRL